MTWIAILLLRFFSLSPLALLYPLARIVSWVLHRVIGYRKAVIYDNLRQSFPEKNEVELRQIKNEYYTFLGDLIVETLKLRTMSAKRLKQRVSFENPEILKAYESNGKNVIIMMGHSGNWEWAGAATALNFEFTMLPVYRKIKNDKMDAYYKEIRSRFSAIPVLDKEAFNIINVAPEPHAVAMLADQTPGAKKGWWTTFLHQDTPFFRGSEVLARRLGYDVVFAHVYQSGRGRYSIYLERFDGELDAPYELTSSFARFLEESIENQPFNWLWSHKRWKHTPHAKSNWMD